MAVIRVVIADDDDAVRRALVAVLSEDDRFEVAGQAGDGTALHTMVDSADPDVVLLDVQMPGGGVEAAKRLRSGTAVVIVVSGGRTPRPSASCCGRASAATSRRGSSASR